MEKLYEQALEICYNLLDDCQLISTKDAESVCYKFPTGYLHNIDEILGQWNEYEGDDKVCPFATDKRIEEHLLNILEDVSLDSYAYDPTVFNSAFFILPEEYYLKLQILLKLANEH
jgi:hypothetical protein